MIPASAFPPMDPSQGNGQALRDVAIALPGLPLQSSGRTTVKFEVARQLAIPGQCTHRARIELTSGH
jgi:hypothetical protein